jgi:hypothetical protein
MLLIKPKQSRTKAKFNLDKIWAGTCSQHLCFSYFALRTPRLFGQVPSEVSHRYLVYRFLKIILTMSHLTPTGKWDAR